jgi:hypothetical protein
VINRQFVQKIYSEEVLWLAVRRAALYRKEKRKCERQKKTGLAGKPGHQEKHGSLYT